MTWKQEAIDKNQFYTNSQSPRQQNLLIFSNVHHDPKWQEVSLTNEYERSTYDDSSLEHLSKALLDADSANSRLTSISISFCHLDRSVVGVLFLSV
jgi:hypothetical protein